MSTDSVDEHRAASRVDQPTTAATALTAMGIVYGDLGTSPLYTLQAVAQVVGPDMITVLWPQSDARSVRDFEPIDMFALRPYGSPPSVTPDRLRY
jgi:hypothetical protein